jgi:hypothetical protein
MDKHAPGGRSVTPERLQEARKLLSHLVSKCGFEISGEAGLVVWEGGVQLVTTGIIIRPAGGVAPEMVREVDEYRRELLAVIKDLPVFATPASAPPSGCPAGAPAACVRSG